MVFYRKYRSQKIEELDSRRVRETLFSVLSAEPAHAFLFTGPKGIGKTSTARIVAKAVNCEEKIKNTPRGTSQESTVPRGRQGIKKKDVNVLKSVEPCNECDQCKSITAGTNMDIVEIDAASNRGIDEIRDLREKIWLSPLKALKKIYIIDEVHMLTTEAFNALLKILEEPPEHAIFILCTTEAHKVPETIVSRCFQIQFKKATSEEIVRSLKRIAQGENLKVDDEALTAIAKMADGGFREAAKIFEEMSLYAQGKKITKESFEKSVKITKIPLQIASLLGAMKERNVKSALQVIEDLGIEGVDYKYFITQVLADLHLKLLKKLGVEESAEDELPVNLRFEVEEIKILIELFGKAFQETKYAVLPQLPLELAVIDFAATGAGGSEKAEAEEGNQATGEVTIPGLRKQVNGKLKMRALNGEEKPIKTEDKKNMAKPDVELMNVPANGDVTAEWLAALWKGIIEEMKKHNHTIAGVLRSCILKSYDNLPAGRQGKKVVIETAYKFHKERLDDNKARAGLMDVCKTLTGNEVEIEVKLKKI